VTLAYDLEILAVVGVHVCAECHQAVRELPYNRETDNREKLSDDAKNNTAVASAA